MKKPKYLYHASARNSIDVLTPLSVTVPKDFEEGSVVFATHCFTFSTQYIVPTDDSWANGGAFGDTCFFVISDKARFNKADKGGTIYLVPSETFKKYNKKEWFSKSKVKTEGSVSFSSGLMAMITHGVQVYFVNKKIYKDIQGAPDHGLSIINNLTCENEKWGRSVIKMDIYHASKKKVDELGY